MWCSSHSGLLLIDDACGVVATLYYHSVTGHEVFKKIKKATNTKNEKIKINLFCRNKSSESMKLKNLLLMMLPTNGLSLSFLKKLLV
jgi:hypothetical protein